MTKKLCAICGEEIPDTRRHGRGERMTCGAYECKIEWNRQRHWRLKGIPAPAKRPRIFENESRVAPKTKDFSPIHLQRYSGDRFVRKAQEIIDKDCKV